MAKYIKIIWVIFCLYPYSAKYARFVVGTNDKSAVNATTYKVEKLFAHKDFFVIPEEESNVRSLFIKENVQKI